MYLDEPELSEPLPGESPVDFRARIGLMRRVLPILADLVRRRFALVVESDRRTASSTSVTSDLVVEFGDSRVRLVLTPNTSDPICTDRVSVLALRHYMLDVPDTDAVAVVADDDSLSTWVFDVYDLQVEGDTPRPAGLADALEAYFEEAVHPIELPNFRGVLRLPTTEVLEASLERDGRAAFEKVRTSRVRIPEKVTALSLLGPTESRNLVNTLVMALRNGEPSLALLLPDEFSDDH